MDENTDDGSKETKEQDDIEQFSMGDCIATENTQGKNIQQSSPMSFKEASPSSVQQQSPDSTTLDESMSSQSRFTGKFFFNGIVSQYDIEYPYGVIPLSLEDDNLVVFYYLGASEIWPGKRRGLW
jgi:hypothetical protein